MMAANSRSLLITDRFGRRLAQVAQRLKLELDGRWSLDPGDFDGSYDLWRRVAVNMITAAQRHNLHLASGYLAAFSASETGRRTPPPTFDADEYVGMSRDGKPLTEALDRPLIDAKRAMSDGKDVATASSTARATALRSAQMDAYHAARGPVAGHLQVSGQAKGWRRVVVGETCGACLAAADGRIMPPSAGLKIHPGCDCVAEPVLSGVEERFYRPDGKQIFESQPLAVQDESLGSTTASLVREGEIDLADLFSEVTTEGGNTFIKQRPISELIGAE